MKQFLKILAAIIVPVLPCLLLAVVLVGCGAPTAAPLPFSKEQAIARATAAARQSAAEVGIIEARIDNVATELITLSAADARTGGTREPGGYAPGQTPDSPVWWVTVRGAFRYEGMPAPPNPNLICAADERDFVYDAQTGDSMGEFIPNTRCAPSQLPGETATPQATITPPLVPHTLDDEVELALGKAELADRKMLCEWDVLGETQSEIYVCFYCTSEIQPGPAGTGQAVIHVTPDGQVQNIQRPRDGAYWGTDVQALFPPPVQARIRLFNYGALADRLIARLATSNAVHTPTRVPADNGYPPWVGTPATGPHPLSEQPLPAGIVNGDIIESRNLLWFIWENTKSRVWFPNGEAYLSLFQGGPDKTRQLVGVTTVPDRWEIVFRTVLNQNQIQQVYLADRISHIIYPLKHQIVPWDQVEKIPTAIGDQYYPILAEK